MVSFEEKGSCGGKRPAWQIFCHGDYILAKQNGKISVLLKRAIYFFV
jgi:hypothetical protein